MDDDNGEGERWYLLEKRQKPPYVYSVFIVHSKKIANCTLATALREWEEIGEENGEQSKRSC